MSNPSHCLLGKRGLRYRGTFASFYPTLEERNGLILTRPHKTLDYLPTFLSPKGEQLPLLSIFCGSNFTSNLILKAIKMNLVPSHFTDRETDTQ